MGDDGEHAEKFADKDGGRLQVRNEGLDEKETSPEMRETERKTERKEEEKRGTGDRGDTDRKTRRRETDRDRDRQRRERNTHSPSAYSIHFFTLLSFSGSDSIISNPINDYAM